MLGRIRIRMVSGLDQSMGDGVVTAVSSGGFARRCSPVTFTTAISRRPIVSFWGRWRRRGRTARRSHEASLFTKGLERYKHRQTHTQSVQGLMQSMLMTLCWQMFAIIDESPIRFDLAIRFSGLPWPGPYIESVHHRMCVIRPRCQICRMLNI